jgi:hypothetical protein
VTARVAAAYLAVLSSGDVADSHDRRLDALAAEERRVAALLAEGQAPEIQLLRVQAGSMNYVEREMQGLRPDVALVGANRSRHEIYDYTGRLMRALGEPSVVIPNHADAPGDQPFLGPMARNVEAFEKEVKAASPTSRVLIPSWFEPITLPERRHHSAKDLLIAERAVELLSTLTWDPREAGSACAVDTNTITLQCAVIRATQEIDGESMVLLHAFTWEVLYQVAVRLGADTPQTDLVATYENRPGATAAEMLSLVRQVRDHIRANLQLEQ